MNKDKRYRDPDGDICEYRHGVWGFRLDAGSRWRAFSHRSDFVEEYYGPFEEIQE